MNIMPLQGAEGDTASRSEENSVQASRLAQSVQATQAPNQQSSSGLVSLAAYGRALNRSKATMWRYRKREWLKPVNLLGKLYLTKQAIEEFEAKVLRGDFAKDPRGCAAESWRRENHHPPHHRYPPPPDGRINDRV